jgi:lysophospholipase L1-like esterase
MSARGRFLSCLVTMVIALAGVVTAGALPAAAAPGTVQYVALGDSYAAGQGAPPYLDDVCKQSDKGYPELLDSEKGIHLQANATCSGAKTSDVADTQLSALNPGIRLVTLTVGGNDLDVSGLATLCLATPADCADTIRERLLLLPALGSDLTDLYAEVADEAPRALIVVTGYPHLLEATAPFPPDLIAALNSATDELNRTIREAVDAADDAGVNIVYVDVIEAFVGHGIGGTVPPPFINAPAPNVDAPFHPNAAGYNAYADAISAALRRAWVDKEQHLA